MPMGRFAKPAEGSWTEHYPELGTGLVSYADSISPEFYELERRAIFSRAWLNVGRVEELPRRGSFFTKDISAAKASVIIVRGTDGEVRAFHNVCRHRGNKILWDHSPKETARGFCRQFVCKYHGWRYGLDGKLNFILQEEEFFDIDKDDFGLIPVHCDVWEGFIFINLEESPRQSLRDFLGPMITGLDGYPFHLLTSRFGFRAPVNANWKIFLDAFQEYYHAPILHSQQQVASLRSFETGFEIPYFQLDGPHRLISTGGWKGVPRHLTPPENMYPIERISGAGLMGPWHRDRPEFELDALPPGVNPGKLDPWSVSTFNIFPNFVILLYERGWYLTYHYWPTSYNTHDWEMDFYFPAPRSASERIQQEVTAVMSKEAGIQDMATLDGTQQGLESNVVTQFPLSDQELTVRHFHKVVGDWVNGYVQEREGAPA
jgi:phenylpropionate dioxygenase-like ring-hydroxylating dioxygenase large terminal subunit